MTGNDRLRAEADRRHREFLQSASNLSDNMQPARLLNELAGALDPDFAWLKRLQHKASQNPVPVLAACAGFLLIIRTLAKRLRSSTPVTRQTRRSRRLSNSTPKGDKNGHNHTAEYF
jgi:hypothetical protein